MSPEPFPGAQAAWFWTVRALAVRHGNAVATKDKGLPRRCDPDDVIRALDGLYRRGTIGPAHARVLRRHGERNSVPLDGSFDRVLWDEAMDGLETILRAKGIVA